MFAGTLYDEFELLMNDAGVTNLSKKISGIEINYFV